VSLILKAGSHKLLEISGPVQVCAGIVLPVFVGRHQNVGQKYNTRMTDRYSIKVAKLKYLEPNNKSELHS
jgi:hypothetical protein